MSEKGDKKMDEIKLPEEEFVPEMGGIPKNFSILVFGPPKSGKTTWGASWKNSLVLECEPGGAKFTRCHKVDVNSYEELRGYYKLLEKDTRFDTLVIDSLDRVAMWIEQEICKELNIGSIMESKKGERIGSQWALYADRVLAFMASWQLLNKQMVFLAHSKKAELADGGVVINPKTISLYGQTANRVMAIVDNIGYLYAQENAEGEIKRYLSFRPGVYVEAGSRHPALTDKIIELPKEGGYEAFAALFNVPTNGHKTDKEAKKELAKAGR